MNNKQPLQHTFHSLIFVCV